MDFPLSVRSLPLLSSVHSQESACGVLSAVLQAKRLTDSQRMIGIGGIVVVMALLTAWVFFVLARVMGLGRAHFPFGPRGSTVSGRQTNVTIVRSTALPTARCLSFFASSHRDFVSHAPTGSEALAEALHSTQAHSAWAVAAEVSRESTRSSEALRPSTIIGLTSVTRVGLRTLFDPGPPDGVARG